MISLAEPALLKDVRRYGRFDANACLNCGTCSVVCELSTDGAPFPRRPMHRVLLGLKQSVRAGLEPWLCHDCGDCTAACPREADPRESMATLRRYLSAQYDLTGLSSRLFLSKAWRLSALAVTFLFVLALALVYHLYYVDLSTSDLLTTPMGLEHMFDTIIYFTVVVYCLPLALMLMNVVHMHHMTMRRDGSPGIPVRHYAIELWKFLLELTVQRRMHACPRRPYKRRWARHWWIVFGFGIISVILIFFLRWFQTDSIYPVTHPQRWLGYLATIGLAGGALDIIIRRARKRGDMHALSVFSDWTLPVMILLTALSGIALHVFRYLDLPMTTHFAYAVHLAIAVPLLVIELPFGKLSHVLYRPVALYFQAVKDRAMQHEQSQSIHKENVAA